MAGRKVVVEPRARWPGGSWVTVCGGPAEEQSSATA